MGAIQPWHIILVLLVFLILFGSKKLPDAARGLGRSMRIFKSEVKEMQNDGKPDDVTPAPPVTRELPTGEVVQNPAPHTTTDPTRKSA
ncbi:Sec-independent protein translocase subunit TatA [Gordonia sp. CPCC 205515]|uniref:Sec-independent protein translocase subunit TatA n=1 Tax=Gordonia sp. CPCC 205515 TaxID=3140791 RepID=UPI003AF3ED8D